MDNSDIFDEEDLLAIAHDDEDDTEDEEGSFPSPAYSSYSNRSVSEVEESNDVGGGCEHDDGGSDGGGSVGDRHDGSSFPLQTSKKVEVVPSLKQSTIGLGVEAYDFGFQSTNNNNNSIDIPRGEGGNDGGTRRSDDDDEDDDDDDDGFLESWLETEKKHTNQNEEKDAVDVKDGDGEEKERLHVSIGSRHNENVNACDQEPKSGSRHRLDRNHSKNTKHDAVQVKRVLEPDSSDDSDGDDLGFLESWSKSERRDQGVDRTNGREKEGRVSQFDENDILNSRVSQHEQACGIVGEERTSSLASTGDCDVRVGNKLKTGELQNKVNLQIGTSVIQWISDHHLTKEKDNHTFKSRRRMSQRASEPTSYHEVGGLVAIQRDASVKQQHPSHSKGRIDELDQPPLLRLSILSMRNTPMRSRSGNDLTEATLEELESTDNASRSVSMQQRGQVIFAPGLEKSTPGTMVDCLARYDFDKGCYVLEIVDMAVTRLTPLYRSVDSLSVGDKPRRITNAHIQNDCTNKEKIKEGKAATSNTSIKRQMIHDPRSRAQRAEDQVRKLKRGKARSGGTGAGAGASSTKKRQRNGTSTKGVNVGENVGLATSSDKHKKKDVLHDDKTDIVKGRENDHDTHLDGPGGPLKNG